MPKKISAVDGIGTNAQKSPTAAMREMHKKSADNVIEMPGQVIEGKIRKPEVMFIMTRGKIGELSGLSGNKPKSFINKIFQDFKKNPNLDN